MVYGAGPLSSSFARAMSPSIRWFMSALMISPAARMALLIACRLDEPWALRMFPRRAHARAPRPLPRSHRHAGTRGDLHRVGPGETLPSDGRSGLTTFQRITASHVYGLAYAATHFRCKAH